MLNCDCPIFDTRERFVFPLQLPIVMFATRISRSVTIAALLVAAASFPASAQRWTRVEGDETCIAIWEEYGRSMSGRQRAVFCEIRDIGVVAPPSTIDVEG